jgi:cytochrome c556
MNKTIAIAALLAAGFSLAGCGQEAKPGTPLEQAVKDRQTNFKAMGAIMKMIDEQGKSDDPDQKKVAEGANRLVTLGGQIPTWFPAGSGADAGLKTNAKPEIWSDNATFLQREDEYMVEAKKLAAVAASGSMAEVTAQYYTTGVACANCHKPFREKME